MSQRTHGGIIGEIALLLFCPGTPAFHRYSAAVAARRRSISRNASCTSTVRRPATLSGVRIAAACSSSSLRRAASAGTVGSGRLAARMRTTARCSSPRIRPVPYSGSGINPAYLGRRHHSFGQGRAQPCSRLNIVVHGQRTPGHPELTWRLFVSVLTSRVSRVAECRIGATIPSETLENPLCRPSQPPSPAREAGQLPARKTAPSPDAAGRQITS